jgi:hypothetical protein
MLGDWSTEDIENGFFPSLVDMRTCCYMSMDVAARSTGIAVVLLVVFVFRS